MEFDFFEEACPLLMSFTEKYSENMLMTLGSLAQNMVAIESFGCEDMLIAFLMIIRFYVSLKPGDFELQDVVTFQDVILFPLLKMQDGERNLFEESPEEFNALAEDCCDKQLSGVLKTEAAKLLEKFGDKVPGSMEYSFRRALDSL